MMNRLLQLNQQGQSIWYDNIQRRMLKNGKFEELIAAGILGVTSNPTIFNKAISSSTDYDSSLRKFVAAGFDLDTIYEKLVLEDIGMAADLLRAVYDRTNGLDGYVSIEVRPTLANDTQATIEEARRLFNSLDRPNIMVKVPATPEGIPAIESLISEGININITLMFSLKHYESVANAYLVGLEHRAAAGEDISHVASVASFFVSRVDTVVDKELEVLGNTSLKGKIGIANSKAVYMRFKQIFSGDRWDRLVAAGARVQRPLWASTSTKNPAYSDTLYIDNLIGPDTVNTVPPVTLEAFQDHGQVRPTLESGLDLALTQMEELSDLGIDLDAITEKLQVDGVNAFAASYTSLMENLSEKCEQLDVDPASFSARLGNYQTDVDDALQDMHSKRVIERIWEHDYTLWKPEPDEIGNRLGWLDIVEASRESLPEFEELVTGLQTEGFSQALLLGMGGSSLAPEVFRKTFGVREGYLDLAVLDSTNPDTIAAQEEKLDLKRTVFIVSTKSGGTVETLSLFKYFYNRVTAEVGAEKAGSHFIAITDAGSQLDKIASRYKFRQTFYNDPNIGGRYSALSFFGLVPAAIIGVDLENLLESASKMIFNSRITAPQDNLALQLGAILGELANKGRDKVTLITSPEIGSISDWIEQLLAESTGKEGKGILPVVGEQLSEPSVYGSDRLFVNLKLSGNHSQDGQVDELEKAGHPVVRIKLNDLYDLGGQFFLWEMATAIAGHLLKINPFNQPNVESAKVRAREMVSAYQDSGELPALQPAMAADGITVYTGPSTTIDHLESPNQALESFLNEAKPGDYICLQAYLQPTSEVDQALAALRSQLRDRTRLATTAGYGPRFLHSTGQLHKGDRGNGLFIQLTSDPSQDIPIPDEAGSNESSISFGVLIRAQSLGDRQALLDANRKVLRFHLGTNSLKGIQKLTASTVQT
ncbi:MAG: bifunctional transaldolase/phosoglucose isomerase [Anaerolineales bacterium]